MSWFKKMAATDDGGLDLSKVPGGAISWRIQRPIKKRKRRKKRVHQKGFTQNS